MPKLTKKLEDLNRFYGVFVYKLSLTRGARYQASRRHRRRTRTSMLSVVFLSLYVSTTSIGLIIFNQQITVLETKVLTFANIVMSIFIIVFAILEAGKRHDLRSEMFLKCAQGIGEIYDLVKLEIETGHMSEEKIKKHIYNYNKIISGFSDNHSEIDYKTFRISIGKHPGLENLIFRVWWITRYWWNIHFIVVLAAASPVFIGLFYFLAKFVIGQNVF